MCAVATTSHTLSCSLAVKVDQTLQTTFFRASWAFYIRLTRSDAVDEFLLHDFTDAGVPGLHACQKLLQIYSAVFDLETLIDTIKKKYRFREVGIGSNLHCRLFFQAGVKTPDFGITEARTSRN